MSLQITYDLVGTGWCRCTVTLGELQAVITGSYLCDCLAGLAAAAVEMAEGATSSRFSFDEEPGEYRWIVERDGDRLRLRIIEFEELWGNQDDAAGKVLIDSRCSVIEFSVAVRDTLDRVLAKHGAAGYKEKWVEHEFPEDLRCMLADALRKMGA